VGIGRVIDCEKLATVPKHRGGHGWEVHDWNKCRKPKGGRRYWMASERAFEIVYPLTDEPWGVRRFFVRDPKGVVVNVMMHFDTQR
jgi:uncharacterized glyoxalase superfamily protein PhnB